MLIDQSKLLPTTRRNGVALVLVLAFIVLLAGLLVAFLTRVTNERVVSDSSTNSDKADLLARSALDNIVADFKQEIADPNNSTTTNVGSGSTASNIYTPKTPANAVPVRSGTADTLPNLIRRSVRPQAAAGAAPSNASPVNSATDLSANGRSVSLARWNSHYLLPRKTPGDASTDSTPVADFTAPDWVLVNRNGPLTATPPTAWDSTMGNPAATNQNYVIGRYAYGVYDEGGLLDANVAGYPSNIPASLHAGRKGNVAFADLTQLTAANGTPLLTQSQVDNLLGWRYHASVQPSGTFPTYSFDSTAATRFFNLVTGTLNGMVDPTNRYARGGYLAVSNATLNSQTDQAFNNRQQLIQLGQSLGFSPDVLQYLGTFSRDLEQPSFAPDPSRPKVQSGSGVNASGNPVISDNDTTFGTGNDAYGYDRETDPSKDINPSFLAVRVTSPFVRADGSTAVVGEPLIKKRFPLSRLGKILHASTANMDQSDPIYRDFGIYRSTAAQAWQYNHGDPTGIQRLSSVTGREPDFFELLKAAINVGSLAKKSCLVPNGSACVDWTQSGHFIALQQAGHDLSTNLQILQIGANIIDQYDSDGYPTRITFSGDTTKEVRGVEDLPYLYGFRLRVVKQKATSDLGRKGALFVTPEIWNPHAYVSTATANGPTQFQIIAAMTVSNTPTSYRILYSKTDATQSLTKMIDWTQSVPLIFSSQSNLFREPTLLTQPGVLAGLQDQSNSMTDNDTGKTVVGIKATDFNWQFTGDTGTAGDTFIGEDPAHGPVTISLQYYDNGVPVTYDQQMYEWGPGTKFNVQQAQSDLQNKKNPQLGGRRTDPRTSRWGMGYTDFQYVTPYIDASNFVYLNQWPSSTNTGGPDGNNASATNGVNPSYGAHFGCPGDNGFHNPRSPYSNADDANHTLRYEGFPAGYWSQNTIRKQALAFGFTSSDPTFYNRDPDGVARRAMGGYVADTNDGVSANADDGLPMTTANTYSGGVATPIATQIQSRPIILNRPFQSVAELGYAFSDTPWKNLDFSFPESPNTALLDVFCVNELDNADAVTAGKVDLNTRQAPVLQALLANAVVTDQATSVPLSDTQVKSISTALVTRTIATTAQKGPMAYRGDLVGHWMPATTISTPAGATIALKTSADPDQYYAGFSTDIGKVAGVKGTTVAFVTGQREAAIRALTDSGTTRTWNLMIDLVTQSGRYATNANSLASFIVEGEKHYWLHVAIDRMTGNVIDSQLEAVSE